MKKTFVVLISLLILSLSACSNNNSHSKSNIVSAADLNERENAIISTTSEQSFVFDFNADTEYEEVSVWIDKYESGELVDDKLGYMTTQTDENGTIILATTSNGEKQLTYSIGVGDKGGTSSAIILDKKLQNADSMATVSGQLTEGKSLNNGEIVLATIAYSDDEYGTSSISSQFYEDPAAHMDELKKYNIVYIFKTHFTK